MSLINREFGILKLKNRSNFSLVIFGLVLSGIAITNLPSAVAQSASEALQQPFFFVAGRKGE